MHIKLKIRIRGTLLRRRIPKRSNKYKLFSTYGNWESWTGEPLCGSNLFWVRDYPKWSNRPRTLNPCITRKHGIHYGVTHTSRILIMTSRLNSNKSGNTLVTRVTVSSNYSANKMFYLTLPVLEVSASLSAYEKSFESWGRGDGLDSIFSESARESVVKI